MKRVTGIEFARVRANNMELCRAEARSQSQPCLSNLSVLKAWRDFRHEHIARHKRRVAFGNFRVGARLFVSDASGHGGNSRHRDERNGVIRSQRFGKAWIQLRDFIERDGFPFAIRHSTVVLHFSIPSSSFMPCCISVSSLARLCRISPGGRCATSAWTTSL